VVVPQVCETKGPVFGTSNKRDLVDLTRGVRARRGRLWIFDPQKVVAQDEPTWWWNPLTYVTDIAKASAMASLFSAAVGSGDKGDAYFEPEGEALLAQYLLAAAVAGETLNTVYAWLNDPDNSAPVTALTAAGETEVALAVGGTSRLPLRPARRGVWHVPQDVPLPRACSAGPARAASRFCTPACRQAAYRRRRAAAPEDTPAQHQGGRSRKLLPHNAN